MTPPDGAFAKWNAGPTGRQWRAAPPTGRSTPRATLAILSSQRTRSPKKSSNRPGNKRQGPKANGSAGKHAHRTRALHLAQVRGQPPRRDSLEGRGVARLLRPSGHLFVYEAHPAAILWTWDEDQPRIREDRSYFGRSHVNDTFPGRGAVEWQWTLGEIITAVAAAGMEILHLGEYPEPFW